MATTSSEAPSFGASYPKVVVKAQDMSEEMRRVAVELSLVALSRYSLERDMARFMKCEMDSRFQVSIDNVFDLSHQLSSPLYDN